jgi:hypothetical protein
MELSKERIGFLISKEGHFGLKMITIVFVFIILCGCIVLCTLHPLNIVLMILCALIITVYVDMRLYSNVEFAQKQMKLSDVLRTAKTGDLVFMRSYYSYDVPEFLFYRCFNALVSVPYFGHVTMVYKDTNDGTTYLVESTKDQYTSSWNNQHKNGIIIHKAEEIIMNYEGRVHFIPTSLQINNADVINYLQQTHHYLFMENGYGCVRFLHDLLVYCGVMIPKKHWWLVTPSYFVDDQSYRTKDAIGLPAEIIRHH